MPSPGRKCTEMVLVATFYSNVSVGAARGAARAGAHSRWEDCLVDQEEVERNGEVCNSFGEEDQL